MQPPTQVNNYFHILQIEQHHFVEPEGCPDLGFSSLDIITDMNCSIVFGPYNPYRLSKAMPTCFRKWFTDVKAKFIVTTLLFKVLHFYCVTESYLHIFTKPIFITAMYCASPLVWYAVSIWFQTVKRLVVFEQTL